VSALQSMKLVAAVALSLALAAPAAAEPGARWQSTASASSGWIAGVAREVEAYGATRRPTSVMAVHGDEVIAAFGDTAHKVNVRSVRKSLLSALYGVLIAEGRISLASTLAELGVDDRPSLTKTEQRATVRDLLMARSGVYHQAAYETSDMQTKRPDRGSHAPGEFWYYNNWDFNALGTIFRRKGGEDIFESFERRIARPIGMEDFAAKDCRYHREASSVHEAYLFEISARDLARFGLLFANGGRWNGKQIVPEAWVRESTTQYSQTDRSGRGYGYLWWTVSPEQAGAATILASGSGGQLVAIIPSKELVVVQTVDLAQNAKPLRTTVFLDLLRKIVALAPGN
jgi:CubicO group peptidase (beta-lactamase class C family)